MICDILIIIVLAIFIFYGMKRGFVRSVYSLVSVALAIFLLYFLKDTFVGAVSHSAIGDAIRGYFTGFYNAEIASVCAYALIYLVSVILLYIIIRFLLKIVFRALDFLAKLPLINVVNSLLGVAFGIVCGMLWIIVIVNVAHCFPQLSNAIESSYLINSLGLLL